MSSQCCSRPIATIIDIGGVPVGIMGLAEILQKTCAAGHEDRDSIENLLLSLARQFGNYVTPGREQAYKDALFREFTQYRKRQNKHIHHP